MATGNVYVIRTNLPPHLVSMVAAEIFIMWRDFALGNVTLGGKRLVYPSGRYAAALSYQRLGESTVAIVADESVERPEVAILEGGHRSFDMKSVSRLQGRAIPMHRMPGSQASIRATGLRRVGAGPPSLRPSMWAELRTAEGSGFASFGPNSSPDSWIIPPMPAYAPAATLAAMARRMASGLGG